MTLFDDVVARAKQQFPNLQVKYKNKSTFMKIIGSIMFFNPLFMSQYFTTIGSTVYAPSQDYVTKYPNDSAEVFLHELVHVYDAQKRNKFLYGFLYMLPQILLLLSIPILFLFGWKFALISLIFLAPLPAYFRMIDERRGYTISVYVLSKFAQQGRDINWAEQQAFFVPQFKGPAYYFAWPFSNIDTYFKNIILECRLNKRPSEVEDTLLDIIDKIFSG